MPRIVSREEFDEAVKAANNGEGFIAQRTYAAPDHETLDAYRSQLYEGKWYVDCSTGGAGYGQGMYCAADYTGTLTDGIKNEMKHYESINVSRYDRGDEYNVRCQMAKAQMSAELGKDDLNELFLMTDAQFVKKYGDRFPELKDASWPGSYTETFTLDPSAKIVTYKEINDIKMGNLSMDYRTDAIKELVKKGGYTEDEATFIRYNLNTGVSWKEVAAAAERLSEERIDELSDEFQKIGEEATKMYNEEHQRRIDLAKIYQHKFGDVGSLAAALGYDAINAERHGASGSYTVVLNRTKLIILGE